MQPAASTASTEPVPASAAPERRVHYPRLDGLRGIAIAAVMLFHFTPTGDASNPLLLAFRSVARVGWAGVDLFFVLSGFLITGILLDTRAAPRRWATFYARRALRIFPLYYAALAGLAILFAVRPEGGVPGVGWLVWCATYVSNLADVTPHAPAFPGATLHFWSLAIEEQFYLVWPFVVWRATPARLLRLSGALVLAAVVVRLGVRVAVSPEAAYRFTFARMDALVIGAVLAVWRRDPVSWARARRLAGRAGGMAVAAGIALVAVFTTRHSAAHADPRLAHDLGMQAVGYTLIAVAAAAAVVRAADGPATGWLARGPLPWLGRYAYGLYVYHWIVWTLVLPVLFRRGWIGPTPEDAPGRGTVVTLVAGPAVSIVCAVASYHLFEAPFLRLKRFFPSASPAPSGGAADPATPAGLRAAVAVA